MSTTDPPEKDNSTSVKELPVFVLPRCIAEFLELDPSNGNDGATDLISAANNTSSHTLTSSDHTYFNALVATETCRALIYKLKDTNRQHYFKLSTDKVAKRATLGDTLKELYEKLDSKLQDVRKEMESRGEVPLLEKFLDLLNASEDEKNIFRFILSTDMMPNDVCVSGDYSGKIKRGGLYEGGATIASTPVALHEMFSISLPKVMSLMNPESIWVKEQLYYNNSRSYSPMVVNLSALTRHTHSALQGYDVSMTQYKGLKSLTLQQCLLEHPPFMESAVGKKILKRNAINASAPTNKNTGVDGAASGIGEQGNVLAVALKISSGGVVRGVGELANGSAEGEGVIRKKVKRDRLFDALAMSTGGEMNQMNQQPATNGGLPHGIDGLLGITGIPPRMPSGLPGISGMRGSDLDEKMTNEAGLSVENQGEEVSKKTDDDFGPYSSDLSYLEDQVRSNILTKKIVQLKTQLEMGDDDVLDDEAGAIDPAMLYAMMSMPGGMGKRGQPKLDDNARFQQEKKLQSMESKLSQHQIKMKIRIQASAQEDGRCKVFRLEQLCDAMNLGEFERSCILHLLQDAIMPNQAQLRRLQEAVTIGTLISSYCVSLEEKMRSRSFFYKSSTMIEEGILSMSQSNDNFTADLSECTVKLDRRLFDFIVGLDTEMSELVNGSHLYKPDIAVDDVILPEKTKNRILDSVLSFNKVKDIMHESGMDEKLSYGLGQILLFYGSSGTGKTMLANAIATKLDVKILLINLPTLGPMAGSTVKFLFREARINKALLFFDECESLFMSREKGGTAVTSILTELERFDGLCVLATNRACDLDEAMYRRISIAVELKKPDHILREKIWRAVQPPELPVDDDIDFSLLGKKYELVGGTVKNAWIQAIHNQVIRGGKTVSMSDLEQAAVEQIRNQITSDDFDRRVVPTAGIETMVLDEEVKESLSQIIQYSKAQAVLFGQWGFDKIHRSSSGISVMLHGVPGTGKTMAAEAIGFDLGRPLLVVNVAELVSKWVGETGSNIKKIFANAKSKDAVLVFDEAESLFGSRQSSSGGSTSRHDNLNVGLLLQYIENFTGICVVITNMKDSIDEAFFRRFRFVLEFKLPDAVAREKIWKSTCPDQCPISKDVDFGELARRYAMSGGGVKNSLLRAATTAALRDGGKHELTMADLKEACEGEEGKMGNKAQDLTMYS
mmetsp:Transcript_16708/g.19244  ORF Transcript_16708/g.19244 Transcript_16708/m.19244 type:complete len:1183 (+) Transcript_16708:634-4182(+)